MFDRNDGRFGISVTRDPFKKLLRNVKLCSEPRSNPKGNIRPGKEVSITEMDLENVFISQNGKSVMFGIDIDMETVNERYAPYAPSVDRIDNDKGYTLDNIVINTRFENLGSNKANTSQMMIYMEKLAEALENGKK